MAIIDKKVLCPNCGLIKAYRVKVLEYEHLICLNCGLDMCDDIVDYCDKEELDFYRFKMSKEEDDLAPLSNLPLRKLRQDINLVNWELVRNEDSRLTSILFSNLEQLSSKDLSEYCELTKEWYKVKDKIYHTINNLLEELYKQKKEDVTDKIYGSKNHEMIKQTIKSTLIDMNENLKKLHLLCNGMTLKERNIKFHSSRGYKPKGSVF